MLAGLLLTYRRNCWLYQRRSSSEMPSTLIKEITQWLTRLLSFLTEGREQRFSSFLTGQRCWTVINSIGKNDSKYPPTSMKRGRKMESMKGLLRALSPSLRFTLSLTALGLRRKTPKMPIWTSSETKGGTSLPRTYSSRCLAYRRRKRHEK